MQKIINLTMQHTLTETQIDAGLYNPTLSDNETATLKKLMIVDPEWSEEEIISQAEALLDLINSICDREGCWSVHIMGQFELVHYVINESHYWDPLCDIAFYVSTTKRVSKEVTNSDGTVTKINTFEFVKLRRVKPVSEY